MLRSAVPPQRARGMRGVESIRQIGPPKQELCGKPYTP